MPSVATPQRANANPPVKRRRSEAEEDAPETQSEMPDAKRLKDTNPLAKEDSEPVIHAEPEADGSNAVVTSSVADARDKKRRRKKKRKTSIVQQNGSPAKHGPSSLSTMSTATTVSNSAISHNASKQPTPGPSRLPLTIPLAATPQPDETQETVANDAAAADSDSTATMSSKGKGRATSTDIADAPAPALDAKSAAIAADLAVHSSLLQSLLPSLTCQICLSLMHRPFALAPCGHVSCYSCLVTWFTEKPPDALQTALEALANGSVPPLPLLEAAPPPPAPARPTIPIPRRKKTCPQCRARVFQKPVEVWLIKDMVKQVVRSGLADPEAVPPELRDGTPAPDGTQNAWAHIFPDGAAEDEARRNVFRAMILRENMGIRDEEDGGIFRCVDCAHELEEGICSHCGRVYPAHDPDWILDDSVGYDEDEGGVGDDLGFMLGHHPELRYLDDDEDSMQSTEEDDLMPGFPPLHWLAHHRHDEHHGDEGEGSEGDGDEGHGEEEDYESSFIDDEDDNGEGGFDEDVLYEIGRAMGLQPSSPIVISSDEEGGPHMRAPRRHSRVIVQSDGEGDDDDDENDEAGPSVREPRRRSQTVVHSDSEEDEDSEAGPPARAPRRQPAFIHSDEEDDEFDAGHEDDFDGRSDENNGFAVGDLAAIVAQRERELYGEDGSVPRGQGGGMSYEWGYSDGGEDDQSNDGGYSDGDGGVYF